MAKPWLLKRARHFPGRRTKVTVFRQEEQGPMGTHEHEFVEIVVVVSGWGLHATGAVRHEIVGGDVMVIHGGRSHSYEETRNLHLVNILLREEFLEQAAKNLGGLSGYHPLFTFEFARWKKKEYTGKLRLDAEDLGRVCGWIKAMEKEGELRTEGGDFLASLWALQLMAFLARNYGKSPQRLAGPDLKMGRVLEKMDRDPFAGWSLAEMSRESGMSERSFLRYFRRATGRSPADYMIRNRIRRAADLLLRERDLSLTEAAFRCGFNDSNYFSRQFRRVMGTSPRAFRLA